MALDIHLLIVDDNAATRYAMRRVLERHGYHVEEAGTGTDGLVLLEHSRVDALVLDVNLPDMSGFDIVRKLRAENRTALLPVIHVSAASIETGDLITGLDAGADAYLIHPVDPDVLLATLRTLLRVRDAELALRESEARFREIFDNVAAPVAVVSATLCVHESNQAFARLLDDKGTGPALAERIVEGQDATLTELGEHLARGDRWHGTILLSTRRGVRETEWRVAPYRTLGTGIIYVDDITEQRQREREQMAELDTTTTQLAREVEEHARTEAQLFQAQKMDALGKLTGGIAHDFNNLLTSIITGVEIMNQRISEGRHEGVQRFADAVLGSARRAAALTHRLLAFARQQPLDARPVDVSQHVRSLGDMLRRTIGETIQLDMEALVDGAYARVDPNQLENAVINLVINARDALPNGGRIIVATSRLEVRNHAELLGGEYISLSVRDNGTGIEPDILDKVFDPFFTTKPLGRGTGLGLSMIYGFARQSGGEALIRSWPGRGTEVTLILPATEAPDVEEPVAAIKVTRGTGQHILLVEDTTTVRVLTAELLTDAGYRCTHVADVDAALVLLRGDTAIDLLLTDVGMPDMDGRALVDIARAWRPRLPVLFMTGYAENALDRDAFLGAGMDMVIKPYAIDDLLARVHTMLLRR
ncbi:hypothetical protein FHW69_001089 [Luteibacter sp. Sphag1AF]|uniref:response regulator n=1 Tax=Luteibacter sp. Sphag1AF TaxID=2587031 RepID=UPI00160D1926|nr:response regulator [Luteibacter sp. Sphag1AF]MBB3226499.1 hypothetical protein [Luteibacter sp. Sphag1AF]